VSGTLQAVHRFPNVPREEDGYLRWTIEGIWRQIIEGLRIARAQTSRDQPW
jgi:sugar (pentulose or hexulose) kinase